MQYLSEAFQALNELNEDVFDITNDGALKLQDYVKDDVSDEIEDVIDPLAETEEDLQDSYIGKVILDCAVCQSKIYKNKEDVVIEEGSDLANVGETCPYCQDNTGYKIIGEVAPYSKTEVDVDVTPKEDGSEEAKVDLTTDEDELDEAIDRTNKAPEKVLKALNYMHKNGKEFKLLFVKDPGTGVITTAQKWAKDNGFDVRVINCDRLTSDSSLDINVKPNTLLMLDELDRANKDTLGNLLATINKCSNVIAFVEDDSNIDAGILNRFRTVYVCNYDDSGIQLDAADRGGALMDEACKTKKGVDKLKDLKKEVNEDLNSITVDTDKETINVTATEKAENGEEMIVPVSDEVKTDIETPVEEEPTKDEYNDVDLDEFDENSFDELGESYLKRVYENVKSYKTVKGSTDKNTLKLEGIITFKSGKQAKTNFRFEAKSVKEGKLKFFGENKQFARGSKPFTLVGRAEGSKLVCESLTYNYRARNNGKSVGIYGTVKTK